MFESIVVALTDEVNNGGLVDWIIFLAYGFILGGTLGFISVFVYAKIEAYLEDEDKSLVIVLAALLSFLMIIRFFHISELGLSTGFITGLVLSIIYFTRPYKKETRSCL